MKQLKILSFLLLILLLPVAVIAQESPTQKWLRSFDGKSGITSVSITSAMFKLLSKISATDPNYQPVVRFASKLQDFRIVLVEGNSLKNANGRSEFDRLIINAPLDKFEELMAIREENSKIVFSVLQQNNHIRELIMMITGTSRAVVYIKGDFKLAELTQISENMDIVGMDKIKQLKKK